MAFGFEEKKVSLPYVEAKGTKHGVVSEYPKFKYHPDVPAGVVVDDMEEEADLGEGWVNSPAEFGVESCPQRDKLAEAKDIVAKAKKVKKAKE